MEYCDKDEANRAKQIAETKMENDDFEGARKIVMKAHKLYPKLDNIEQMLIICDVHCSAQRSSSSSSMPTGYDKDWYAVLQVEKFVDEITVRKQYKKLALLLHPDKNKFPGAEAAFKLICQANEVLSDPKNKSLYDSKIRVASADCYTNQHTRMYKNMNVVFFYCGKVAVRTPPVVNPGTFWTRCTFCGHKYHIIIEYLNKSFRCCFCFKDFIMHETSDTGFDEEEVPNEGVKNDMGSSDRKTAGPENGKIQTEKGSNHNTVGESDDKVSGDTYNSSAYNSSCGLNDGAACNGGDAKTGDLKIESRKRRAAVESSSENGGVAFPRQKRQKDDAALDNKYSNQTGNGFPTDADYPDTENTTTN